MLLHWLFVVLSNRDAKMATTLVQSLLLNVNNSSSLLLTLSRFDAQPRSSRCSTATCHSWPLFYNKNVIWIKTWQSSLFVWARRPLLNCRLLIGRIFFFWTRTARRIAMVKHIDFSFTQNLTRVFVLLFALYIKIRRTILFVILRLGNERAHIFFYSSAFFLAVALLRKYKTKGQ